MNAVFADTSGLLALLNAEDENHARAERAFANSARVRLRSCRRRLCSSKRMRSSAAVSVSMQSRSFRADFAPLVDVVWVDEALHNAGLDLLLDRRKRSLSLVDAVSFVTMRLGNVVEAFAFDPHFAQEGFSVVS